MRWIVILFLLISCSPSKRLKRILDKNPQFTQVDTVLYSDTFYSDRIIMDTLIDIDSLHDTVYISKDRLHIKTVYKDNQIYIEGKCETDTIFVEKKIPVEKIIYPPPPTWFQKNKWWLILVTGALIYIYVRKKLPILP